MIKRKFLSPAYERKTTPVVDDTPKKKKCCLNCKFSYLMQSEKWNPVVAHCLKSNERNVASTPISKKGCGYEENADTPTIHPMIDVRMFAMSKIGLDKTQK